MSFHGAKTSLKPRVASIFRKVRRGGFACQRNPACHAAIFSKATARPGVGKYLKAHTRVDSLFSNPLTATQHLVRLWPCLERRDDDRIAVPHCAAVPTLLVCRTY